MPRIPRIVQPRVPHHVTQRGGRRMQVFFEPADYRQYLRQLGKHAQRWGLEIWAYCLMPNHVHLIVVPETRVGLSRALGRTHREHALEVNRRHGWRGHLWQERFWSCALGERHLAAAIAYVLFNPVRAKLVEAVEDWPYTSAAALTGRGVDPLVDPLNLRGHLGIDWERALLEPGDEVSKELRRHTSTGRPLAAGSSAGKGMDADRSREPTVAAP